MKLSSICITNCTTNKNLQNLKFGLLRFSTFCSKNSKTAVFFILRPDSKRQSAYVYGKKMQIWIIPSKTFSKSSRRARPHQQARSFLAFSCRRESELPASEKFSRVIRSRTRLRLCSFHWILRHYIADNSTCVDRLACTACSGLWSAVFGSAGACSSSHCDTSLQRCVRCLLERSSHCAVAWRFHSQLKLIIDKASSFCVLLSALSPESIKVRRQKFYYSYTNSVLYLSVFRSVPEPLGQK